jgi:hypothetical protein
MNDKRKKTIKLILRIVITVLCLTWVLTRIDLAGFRRDLTAADWFILPIVWLFNVGLYWVRCIRLRMIFKQQGCDITDHRLFAASAVMTLYGMVMPGALSLGVKWYILKQDTGSGGRVLCAMLYNQLAAMFVMTAFGLAALMVTNPASLLQNADEARWLPLMTLGLLAVTVAVYVLMLSGFGIALMKRLAKSLFCGLPRVRARVLTLLDQIAVFRTASLSFHLAVLAITAVTGVAGGALIYWLAAMSAHIDVSIGVLVWLWAMVYILGRVPISIANLGVREAVVVAVLGLYGVPKSSALLMSVIIFSAQIVIALIGAGYQITWSRTSANRISPQP